ncbi:MAG TPA: AEC family transporter [Candidatus Nanoarchaeia archaeon]|nr:AEC family transporter [Candidatus Nanoarchaeia archaeon]
MAFELILNTVIPVFLIILAGFLVGRFRKVNVQPFVDFLVYLTGPSLIFTSMVKSDVELSDFWVIVGVASAVVLLLLLLSYLFFRKLRKPGLHLPIAWGNTGYMGYPIALFAFGTAGLSRAILFDVVNSFFLYSIGIFIVHHRNNVKEIFKVPLIYAVVLGFVFSMLRIPIPKAIFTPLETIGLITIPLALMVLGYRLREIKLTSLKVAVLASLLRVVGGFFIAFLIVSLLSISGLVRNIVLLEAAMPSAVMSMILTAKYKRDAGLTASVVLVSTVLSILSIPLILWFVA